MDHIDPLIAVTQNLVEVVAAFKRTVSAHGFNSVKTSNAMALLSIVGDRAQSTVDEIRGGDL